jgi:S1-C subfamily serine protease
LAVCGALLLAASGHGRQWTDNTGKHRIEAEFVEQRGNVVRLKRPDGSVFELPLDRLSTDDQDFIRKTAPSATNKSAATNTAEVPSAKNSSAPLFVGVKTQAELERIAAKQSSINSAVSLYKLFLQDPNVSDSEKNAARLRLPYWEEMAKGKALRIGNKWIAEGQLEQLQKDEERLLTEAVRMMEVGNDSLAQDRLQQASKINPFGIRAEYVLGMLCALRSRDSAKAETHFSECVKRRIANVEGMSNEEKANLICCLNNLALTEIRQRKYDGAIKHWKTAAKLAPPPRHMIQNAGRLVYLAEASPKLGISPGAKKSAGDFYAEISTKVPASRFEKNMGWLYMELFSALQPTAKATATSTAATSPTGQARNKELPKFLLVASGSGFVVQSHYVATNHHVVDGADRITLAFNDAPDKEFDAQVVLASKGDDLAVVRCDQLDRPPLPIDPKPPRLATDIVLVGFPETEALGTDLKATRGSISGLPNPDLENHLLYDAVTNAGNSGGPVCDQAGMVVAVHCQGLGAAALHSLNAGKLGAGVPAAQAKAFFQKALPGFEDAKAGDAQRPWADVVEAVGRSTCFIRIYKTPANLGLTGKIRVSQAGTTAEPEKFMAIEDPWCMYCNGRGTVECPVRSCARGLVPSQRQEVVGANPVTGQQIINSVPTRVTCSTCKGRGKVNCSACRGGLDPSIGR